MDVPPIRVTNKYTRSRRQHPQKKSTKRTMYGGAPTTIQKMLKTTIDKVYNPQTNPYARIKISIMEMHEFVTEVLYPIVTNI